MDSVTCRLETCYVMKLTLDPQKEKNCKRSWNQGNLFLCLKFLDSWKLPWRRMSQLMDSWLMDILVRLNKQSNLKRKSVPVPFWSISMQRMTPWPNGYLIEEKQAVEQMITRIQSNNDWWRFMQTVNQSWLIMVTRWWQSMQKEILKSSSPMSVPALIHIVKNEATKRWTRTAGIMLLNSPDLKYSVWISMTKMFCMNLYGKNILYESLWQKCSKSQIVVRRGVNREMRLQMQEQIDSDWILLI